MDFGKITNAFKAKDGAGGRGSGAARGKAKDNKKVPGRGVGSAGAAGARGQAGRRGQSGGREQAGASRSGKIAPMSPSRARLERRANDEKIIKTIKIIFTTIVVLAVIGVLLSIFLYVYRPAVATVGGLNIEQFEFTYFINAVGGNNAGLPDKVGQQAIELATESKIRQVIAKEKGLATLTAEDKESIKNQMEWIEQLPAQDTTGASRGMNGDEYLRSKLGISKSQYKKIFQAEIIENRLIEQEREQIVVPEEDALAAYDEKIDTDYKEATVRHILFMYEGKAAPHAHEEGEEHSEDEVIAPARTNEESRLLAEQILERVKNGEDMAALVQEFSEDNDLTNEGIYVIKPNESYEPGFLEWTFDKDRQVGDAGICETSYGYHVMKLEGFRIIPFEEVSEDIINTIKTDELKKITDGWKNDPKYQIQKNDRIYESVLAQTLGTV